MIGRLELHWRRFRRRLSRSEWLARFLKLPPSTGSGTEQGLILIQIDGLSRRQLKAALRRRRMPFLRRLIRREGYQIHTHYSGLPSTTPAVQGELFYGVRGAVPAFFFREAATGQLVRMLDPGPAARVQERLQGQADGVLAGGSAYCDIYSGGAAEPHFCSATIGWGSFLKAANPLALASFVIWNFGSIVRTIVLAFVELWLAVYDFARGRFPRRQLWSELKYIPGRVVVSVVLRELITIGATIDAARGLPVIHLNYLGYDEQAHRRGPASAFAHWSLKGIDGSIRRVWKAARRSSRRDYDVWVYADHGQEGTVPYDVAFGRGLDAAVAEIFGEMPIQQSDSRAAKGEQGGRAQWVGGGPVGRLVTRPASGGSGLKSRENQREAAQSPISGKAGTPHEGDPPPHLVVAAMGPVGHLYPPREIGREECERLALLLVERAHIPAVLVATDDGATAWTARGRFDLPRQIQEVVGDGYVYRDELGRDLVNLCRHPEAGKFLLLGWRPEGKPLSFVHEKGAHAGPGRDETAAFALTPVDVFGRAKRGDYVRPADLRAAAAHRLMQGPSTIRRPARRRGPSDGEIRIVTYNVHSCIGMDGESSPRRIARVLARLEPDIVALQELDVSRPRTGAIDQAHRIAQELEMEFHFHPALKVEEELYGDAILSPHPLRLIRAAGLPGVAGAEPRGAMWVAIQIGGRELQLVNTHLGLSSLERQAQVEALLGPDWLGHPDCRAPMVLCGDFNAVPASKAYKRLVAGLKDAQREMNGHRPKRTFNTRYPLSRIDHVFFQGAIEVSRVEIPRAELERIASDHLPLVVDLRLL